MACTQVPESPIDEATSPRRMAPAELGKFFCTQPALEHPHIMSLSMTNVSGLLVLADSNVCPDLNALFIQMSSNSLAEDRLIATSEPLWVPRRQTHERMRQARAKKPFIIRVNGCLRGNLGIELVDYSL
jgi:hypothetical protein